MRWDDLVSNEFWVRVGAALLCGFIVGVERQLKGKPAGMRTSMLICLGTMVFVRLGVDLGGSGADPTRVLGQVVTGIGFLGAGVILTREGIVVGITSAAAIWVLAAAGAAIGLDRPGIGLAISGLTVLILVVVSTLEKWFGSLRRGVHAETQDQRR